MIVRKIKFKNSSWVTVLRSDNGIVVEVHSNGLVYTHEGKPSFQNVCRNIIETLTPARGEVVDA